MRPAVAAGSCFAHDLVFGQRKNPSGRPILNRSAHAGTNFRDLALDIQLALDSRHEIGHFFLRTRMLQVVKRAAIGDGAHDGGEL